MNARTQQLLEVLDEKILVLDGSTGVALQGKNLGPADFGGPDLEGCNEALVLHRPDVIRSLHDGYFEAGADMVETDTFGGTPLVLAEYGLEARAREINRRAAEIARQSAAVWSTPARPRFVAGSIGPTTKSITVTGGVTFALLLESFRIQSAGLLEGGADVLLLETTQDTRNLKAGLLGARRAMDESGIEIPIMVSATIEPTGTMLAGQGIEAFAVSVAHVPLLSIGLNCATGPEAMTDRIRSLSRIAKTRVSCYPNAGLPDENGLYSESPEMLAAALVRFAEHGWLNVVGGCCGTNERHVRALAEAMEGRRPRRIPDHSRCFLSGIELLEVDDESRPIIVGERTNVLGSRKFKRLVAEGSFEAAAEVARAQVRAGAQVIDVCLQDPDRNELADTIAFLEKAIRMVKVPFMIDSTDAEVVERALEYCQGKAIVNSINLEDGEERFRKVVPLARSYGAALVVGCIDEDPVQGMAVTRERKLAVARRSFELLTEKYGVPPEDIVFDPLVFPCGTGDAAYVGSAAETVEAIRLVKAEFPVSKTLLGISNVSFGLPEAGREVLNSVFLYHATKAGLDLAIVNSERLVRYPSIPEEERLLAENLLFARGADPLGPFVAWFKAKGPAKTAPPPARSGSAAVRVSRAIVEGTKEGLVADLEELRATGLAPLEIVNGPLMAGMAEVGRLFNANELIVAEVLQSAEAMKAGVDHLQRFMEKSDASGKGKVLLATVKGDVHDIGKNLVDIIFTNNGYNVVNLGIKVPPEALVAAAEKHRPDVIGLSGLLVKSAQQMVTTAEDLASAGIRAPMLVGGAALTEKFTDLRIAPAYGGGLVAYAQDAMRGLALLERITSPGGRSKLEAESAERRRLLAAGAAASPVELLEAPAQRSAAVEELPPLPPPDQEEHLLDGLDLAEVGRYVNPQMLYGKHLGLRGSFRKLRDSGDPKALELEALVERIRREGWFTARAVWRFFEAESDGNRLTLFRNGEPAGGWSFPRQRSGDHLCLADWAAPSGRGARDSVALFVVTAGDGVRKKAEELKGAGEYLLCHALQALAVETAEAAAEWLHRKIRERWGFPDPESTSMMDRFQARYRGKRYSFGYPACPDLSGQTLLFELLRPERIGVELTDGFMMDPEASVSALVFHHPQAHYFGA
jgi:5-methyltetrahydrofolate--homocysteine methyltransferase